LFYLRELKGKAARIKEKYNKPTIIISEKNDIGKASARSIIGFDIGSVILSAVKENILLKGGGHKMAGGFSINMKFLDKFKEYVFKKFKKIDNTLLNKKIIYIDSHISSSALNLEFYDQVNKLAPFGSGNPEPRFIIEKLRTVNSKIVGEKHIKSILLAGNGSTISSIAFNAVDSELGGYLLKNNKKNFDIVGKISLNEWKGKKNVEFIIDDISVNK
jgi:single-stranded-DNA-specific exonuclease